MCFQSLNNMISAIRKIQFGLPNLGIRKCATQTVHRHDHVAPTTAWTLFSVIRQNT